MDIRSDVKTTSNGLLNYLSAGDRELMFHDLQRIT